MKMQNSNKLQKVDTILVDRIYSQEDLLSSVDGLVPMFSTAVQCGLFGIQDDHIESYLSLDEFFIRNKHSTFIFKMEGDSMSPQILPGDYLIVDRAITNFINRVVIVDIFDERICKLLVKEQGLMILRSFNQRHKDIVVTQEMDMRIFGVATLCFRDLVMNK